MASHSVNIMMRKFKIAALCSLSLLTACSSVQLPSLGGMAGVFDRGDSIEISTKRRPNPNSPLTKYAATIRLGKFADERKVGNPHKIGSGGKYVSGLSSDDILVSQEVALVVAANIRNRMDDAGFLVLEDRAANAVFELSGSVKEFSLNVKARDEISIGITYTLTETATGKVVWSGLVFEKNDRFAGVSGNSRSDIAEYLKNGLWVVSGKATDAISASLMAARPELFNLTPGTRPVPGVTVYVAPTVSAAVPVPAAPIYQGGAAPAALNVPPPAYAPRASATTGLLVINTNPARAKVYVDGVYFGLSPLRVEVDPGVHAISVKLEGYKMATDKVSVRRGDNTEMELALER